MHRIIFSPLHKGHRRFLEIHLLLQSCPCNPENGVKTLDLQSGNPSPPCKTARVHPVGYAHISLPKSQKLTGCPTASAHVLRHPHAKADPCAEPIRGDVHWSGRLMREIVVADPSFGPTFITTSCSIAPTSAQAPAASA